MKAYNTNTSEKAQAAQGDSDNAERLLLWTGLTAQGESETEPGRKSNEL